MNITKVASQAKKIVQPLAKPMNKVADSIGSFVGKNDVAKKVIGAYEPNGGDNNFFGLGTIMIFAVLIPRILTALKRNPENKEATKDEINGILRRDVVTILTMLFALKSMNSIAGNVATKLTGIPMTNKPYQKLFDENAKTFGQKTSSTLGAIFNNIKDTLNPVGGCELYTGRTITNNYTDKKGLDGAKKTFEEISANGGNAQKVFTKMKDSIVSKATKIINKLEEENFKSDNSHTPDVQCKINRAQAIIDYYNKLTYEDFMGIDKMPTNLDYEGELTKFFADKNNTIARTANKVKVMLQWAVLGIEVFFLGFGLPSINQKALEKKYLSEKPIGEQKGDNFVPLNDRHIKAQEIKLYSQFIK